MLDTTREMTAFEKAHDYIMTVTKRQLRWLDLDTLYSGYSSLFQGPNMLSLAGFTIIYNATYETLCDTDQWGDIRHD